MRYDIFIRWNKNQLSPPEKQMMGVFFNKYLVEVFSYGGYGLFRLDIDNSGSSPTSSQG